MSMAKRIMDETEWYYKCTKEILFDIKAIKTCPFHPDSDRFYYCDETIDNRWIYGTATKEFTSKFPDMKNNALFRAQIKRILDEAQPKDECPICLEIRN